MEHEIKEFSISLDEVKLSFDYEQVTILFLKHEYEDFKKVLDEIGSLEESREILVGLFDQFPQYRDMIQAVSKKNNVRNIAAIMTVIIGIVKQYLAHEGGQQ